MLRHASKKVRNVAAGTLEPKKLITHEFRIDEVMKAYDTFGNAAGERALKVLLKAAQPAVKQRGPAFEQENAGLRFARAAPASGRQPRIQCDGACGRPSWTDRMIKSRRNARSSAVILANLSPMPGFLKGPSPNP